MASGPPISPSYDPSHPPEEFAPSGHAPGEYRWLPPANLPPGFNAGAGVPPGTPDGGPGRTALYELRPLSTGEVLDRTFSLYRARFPLFAGIAALSALVRLLGQAAQLGVQNTVLRHGGPVALGVTSSLLSLGMSAIFLLAFAITQAATVWAVGEVYLRRTASVSGSVRATLSRWLRYVGIALWQLGSAAWPALLVLAGFGGVWYLKGRTFGMGATVTTAALAMLLFLAAFAVGLIQYLRNLLGVPAAVREGLGVRAAMRRSKVLSRGAKGKLFLVLLIAAALYFVMGILLVTVLSMTMLLHGGGGTATFLIVGILTLIVVFAGYTLISPVVMIGVTLVYFDQRVRREAFDLQVLLGDESVLGSGGGVPLNSDGGLPPGFAPAPPGPTSWMAGPPLTEPLAAEPAPVEPAEPAALPLADSSAATTPLREPPGGASGL